MRRVAWLILLAGCTTVTAPVPPPLTVQEHVTQVNQMVQTLYRQGHQVRFGVISLCDSCPPYLVLQETR